MIGKFKFVTLAVMVAYCCLFAEKAGEITDKTRTMLNGDGGLFIVPGVICLDAPFKLINLDNNEKVVQLPIIKDKSKIGYRPVTDKCKILIVNNENVCSELDTASICLRDGYVVLNDKFGNYKRDVMRLDKVKIMILFSALRHFD